MKAPPSAPTPASSLAARAKARPRTARADAEHVELAQATRVAVIVGLFTWPTFALLDVFMCYVVVPEVALTPFLVYRLVGLAFIVLAHYSIRPATRAATTSGPPALPSRARIALAEALVFVGAALMISLMALRLGGLRSNYVHGISIVILVRGAAVPSRWRRTVLVGGAAALCFPVVMAVHALLRPDVGAVWASGKNVAGFVADYVFVIATVVLATVSSHAVWAARRAVRASRKLGRYVLKARIGIGGMGEVWLARDDALGRNVALKMLRVSDSEEAISRFEREAHAASSLSNPHSVRVFDFGSDEDGTWFIAMEHLIGADLDALVLEHGPLPVSRVVRLARQACASLTEAHEGGIIHRDIKPENLFVTRVGDDYDFLKLLDFGVARMQNAAAALTAVGVAGGTPRYLAPELWTGAVADARSEIYSLGGALYFLLTGAPPFDAGSITELAAAHAVLDAAPPSSRRADGDSELDAVVLKCLAKDPDDRFQSMRELDAALERCVGSTAWTSEDARLFWSVTRPQTHERSYSTRPPVGVGTTLDIPLAPRAPTNLI